MTPIQLNYDGGTVLVTGPAGFDFTQLPLVKFDPRTNSHRAQGRHYRGLVEYLLQQKIAYEDHARRWDNQPSPWTLHSDREPHPHQAEALQVWWRSGRRGVVVLPTGTGKTYVAVLAIAKTQRPTLIVTPTLDLMRQWHGQLENYFQCAVGAVGGGDYEFQPLTVTTYDSAYIHLERWANRFGFLIFDECHHLPGATYQESAIGALAPFRLGLTATPERADGGEQFYPELIGPIVYRREITELSGEYLADYITEKIPVELTEEEQARYDAHREKYLHYLRNSRVNLSGPKGWQQFIFEASRTPEGWEALRAYREQKRIERTSEGKFLKLQELLVKHAGEQILIFTADNATVYEISRRYLVPAITHQTRVKERKLILEKFHLGEYRILATSQVLNEGVDVPAASVGIVLSGTGSIKENVQRLGRILRKYGDKKARLYEVVAIGTAEESTSERRRQHGAFQ